MNPTRGDQSAFPDGLLRVFTFRTEISKALLTAGLSIYGRSTLSPMVTLSPGRGVH